MPDLKLANLTSDIPGRADIEMTLYNDETFSSGPAIVSNEDRAIQDVVRGLLTQIGSNELAPNFGTNISNNIHGRKINSVTSRLTSDIQRMLSYLGAFNVAEPLTEQIIQLNKLEAQDGTNRIQLTLEVQTGGGHIASISL